MHLGRREHRERVGAQARGRLQDAARGDELLGESRGIKVNQGRSHLEHAARGDELFGRPRVVEEGILAQHPLDRPILMREAIRGHQRPSEGTSEAIRRNIKGHQKDHAHQRPRHMLKVEHMVGGARIDW